MALNIKDQEVHKLAKELQRETGESMSRAVKVALRERLERVRRSKKRTSAAELLAIGRRCAATLDGTTVDHGQLLYDDRGIPR